LSGLRWSAGLRFLGQLLTWIITIFVMRTLSPQDYGLMGMAGVFLTYLATINELGLGAAIIQDTHLSAKILRQMFGLLLVVNGGLFLTSIMLAPSIASFFGEPGLASLIRFLAIQFIITSFVIIPRSLIDREMSFRQRSIVELISAIAGSLITLVLALKGWGVWSLVWGSLILNFLMAAGFNLIKPALFLPIFSLRGMRQVVSFGGYVTASRILWTFYTQSDIIIVGKLLGQRLLGFYSVALTLAALPMEKISGIVNQVAFPAFASIRGDIQTSASHFLKAIRMMSLTAFPVLWGIASISEDLVNTLLGHKWEPVIAPLQILSLVIPIRMISNLINPMLLGVGRPDTQLFNIIVLSSVLPLGFLLGSRWGIIGVSLVWATVFPLAFLLNMSRAVRALEISLYDVVRQMIAPMAAAMIMYITVFFIIIGLPDINPIPRLISCIIAGALVYTALVVVFAKNTFQEAWGLIRR